MAPPARPTSPFRKKKVVRLKLLSNYQYFRWLFGLVVSGMAVAWYRSLSSSILERATTSSSKWSSSLFRGLQWHRQQQQGQSQLRFRTVQVHIVHRHGDRTPITPLRNEDYWKEQLVPPKTLQWMSSWCHIVRNNADAMLKASFHHNAAGKGPFGKLTQLGLEQMIQLGTKLRQDFLGSTYSTTTSFGSNLEHVPLLRQELENNVGLLPEHVQVLSTDFDRTIQSVQGVLIGMFPDLLELPRPHQHHQQMQQYNSPPVKFVIDVQNTNWMIPDPQPRATQEQVDLEKILATQPTWVQREERLKPLALQITRALQDMLGDGAMDMSFGVAEDNGKNDAKLPQETKKEEHPLSWTQLAEITKCLRVRNLLPPSITEGHQEQISSHLAARWFDLLRHPRLSYLAMNRMASFILQRMERHHQWQFNQLEQDDTLQQPPPPPITILSAHDSTLIGLMGIFQLEQPAQWPEYGAYLKIELLEVLPLEREGTDSMIPQLLRQQHQNHHEHKSPEKEYWVQFSLNGQVLPSLLVDREVLQPSILTSLRHREDYGLTKLQMKENKESNNLDDVAHFYACIPLQVLARKLAMMSAAR